MFLKTVLWNYQAGKVRKHDAPPAEDASYIIDDLDYIIRELKKINADVIFLVETHSNSNESQVPIIAKGLDIPFFVNGAYETPSHVDENYNLGTAIISRFPISESFFQLFVDPHFSIVRPDGKVRAARNKGILSATISFPDGKSLVAKSLHVIPFHRYNRSALDPELQFLRSDMADKIMSVKPKVIAQGDFNFNEYSLKSFLPSLFEHGFSEVIFQEPTTPHGYKFDHVLYKGVLLVRSVVHSDVLTDHYLIYSEFEV